MRVFSQSVVFGVFNVSVFLSLTHCRDKMAPPPDFLSSNYTGDLI